MYYPKFIENPKVVRRYFGLDFKPYDCYEVEIEGEDYVRCVATACGQNYWAESKSGDYGSGVANTKEDPHCATRTGLLGQMAFGKIFGEGVDLDYRRGGDEYDNLLVPLKPNLKTLKVDQKTPMYNRGEGVVLYRTESGVVQPLDKDIYVFNYIHLDRRDKDSATVIVVGYAFPQQIAECRIARGRGKKPGTEGNHWNYYVPFDVLRPIGKFRDYKLKNYGIKVVRNVAV
jgi:hypothetical protein